MSFSYSARMEEWKMGNFYRDTGAQMIREADDKLQALLLPLLLSQTFFMYNLGKKARQKLFYCRQKKKYIVYFYLHRF